MMENLAEKGLSIKNIFTEIYLNYKKNNEQVAHDELTNIMV